MKSGRRPSRQTHKLLVALLDAPTAWRYGLVLSRETGLKSGTLYPILMRLADRGLLDSRWEAPEQPGLPARHMYRLTPEGLAFARQALLPDAEAPVRAAVAVAGAGG